MKALLALASLLALSACEPEGNLGTCTRKADGVVEQITYRDSYDVFVRDQNGIEGRITAETSDQFVCKGPGK